MSDLCTDTSKVIGDEAAAAIRRGAEFLEIAKNSLVLTQTGAGPRIRLEHIPVEKNHLSNVEFEMLAGSVNRMNEALDADLVAITPGISTLDMKGGKKAFDFLFPDHFDWEAYENRSEYPVCGDTGQFADIGGQWVPPGVTVTFTAAETQAILAAIGVGLVGSLAAILKSAGVAAPVATPLAIALMLVGLPFAACRLASKTGQVGIKYTLFPVFVAIPFPA